MKEDPLISILITADNETSRIIYLLGLLRRIQYPNLEIIIGVYNPHVLSMAAVEQAVKADKRFRIFEIESLNKDWQKETQISYLLGKQAKGNYLLFMDATLELSGGILEILISYMKSKRLGLLSVIPAYDMHTRAEWMSLPIFNQMYLTIFPLWMVLRSKSTKAVTACRKFMLFEGEIYRHFQPFEEVRYKKDNSLEIARYLKSESIRIDCLIGDKRVRLLGSVTWRRCLSEVSQNLLHFMGRYNLLGFLYALIMSIWWIPFLLLREFDLLFLGVIEILVTQVIVARVTRIPVKKSLLYFFPQTLILLSALWTAVHHLYHKWRWEKKSLS